MKRRRPKGRLNKRTLQAEERIERLKCDVRNTRPVSAKRITLQAVDALEDEAVRRAYEGVERAVTVAGQREIIREYSDTLLIFLLKGARPERYRDNLRLKGAFQLNMSAIAERLCEGRRRVAEAVRVLEALPAARCAEEKEARLECRERSVANRKPAEKVVSS